MQGDNTRVLEGPHRPCLPSVSLPGSDVPSPAPPCGGAWQEEIFKSQPSLLWSPWRVWRVWERLSPLLASPLPPLVTQRPLCSQVFSSSTDTTLRSSQGLTWGGMSLRLAWELWEGGEGLRLTWGAMSPRLAWELRGWGGGKDAEGLLWGRSPWFPSAALFQMRVSGPTVVCVGLCVAAGRTTGPGSWVGRMLRRGPAFPGLPAIWPRPRTPGHMTQGLGRPC